MINREVLEEKLKYLIISNARHKKFEILELELDLEYTKGYKKLEGYDLTIKFEYNVVFDSGMEGFSYDIRRMSDVLIEVISEYVISQEGKIVNGANSNCFTTDPLVLSVNYEIDETHTFLLSYKFNYVRD